MAAFLGAFLFGGGWWLIGKQYENEEDKQRIKADQTSTPTTRGSAPTTAEEMTDRSRNSSNEKQRPTAIKIRGGKNITIRGNVGIGDMDLLDVENVENMDADKNILITPKDAEKK